MRILAVDDDSSILELLPRLAAKAGFPDVTAVASGELALQTITLSDALFECLLLDINMPDMDGIELCAQVRQLVGYQATPIIMLTAMSDHDYIDNAFKAGASDYATKPFDIQELGARLRVAQEIVTANKLLLAALAASTTASAADRVERSVHLDEPVFVSGTKDLIDFKSFRNYIKQMSRSGLAATQIIAIKIDRIANIHSQTSSAEFIYALTEVAHSIVYALQTRSSVTSYAGHGLFVSLARTTVPLDANQIESDIQQVLDEKGSAYDSGAPLDLEVSAGTPALPHFTDSSDVSLLIERVIARAEHRSASKGGERGHLNIRQIRF